jgi:hypothetical protein
MITRKFSFAPIFPTDWAIGISPAGMFERITSVSLQKRTGVFSLVHYLASHTFLWAGHVARMPKSRSPKRLMLPWVMEPRIAGRQEMTYGRSLECYLKHFGQAHAGGSAPAFTEWATFAQDCAGWRKLVTKRPFGVGKPHVRPPRYCARVSPEDIRRYMAQRAPEVAQRRAILDFTVATPTP